MWSSSPHTWKYFLQLQDSLWDFHGIFCQISYERFFTKSVHNGTCGCVNNLFKKSHIIYCPKVIGENVHYSISTVVKVIRNLQKLYHGIIYLASCYLVTLLCVRWIFDTEIWKTKIQKGYKINELIDLLWFYMQFSNYDLSFTQVPM